MSKFTPSKYQAAVFEFIEKGSGNAVVNAVAGSGKTTTILEAMKLIPSSFSVTYLAFNKAIVEEFKPRVPAHVQVQTLHSLGNSALMKYRRMHLNNYVVSDIVKNMSVSWNDVERDEMYAYTQRVKKLVDLLRINLVANVEELCDLAIKHDIEIINGECDRAFEVVNVMKYANTGQYDFVDMLYMPASVDAIKMPQYDFVFIDECQDLNKAQQALIKKIMKPTSRFIAVGDPRQAIYGFAGADIESFTNLVNQPNTVQLPLSVNYRCGKKVIEYVKNAMPNLPIEAFENAIDGVVVEEASYKSIQDGDYVLCRNVAPLVALCLEFIGQQRKAYIKGGDIGKSLVSLVKKSKKAFVSEMLEWLEKDLVKIYDKLSRQYPSLDREDLEEMPTYRLLNEKITVLETIASAQDITQCFALCTAIESIFADDKDGICFSSVHKAKGLEADNVFIINRDKFMSKRAKKAWQVEQERNLIYVAYTRAKKSLNFVADWTYEKGKDDGTTAAINAKVIKDAVAAVAAVGTPVEKP